MNLIKTTFVAGMLVSLLGAPVVYAQMYDDPSGLRLSPSSTTTSEYGNSTQPGDVTLKGHVTAIPKGTTLMVKVDAPMSSASSKIGDPVSGVVETDLIINGQLLVPAGSQALGSVTSVRPSGRVGQHGQIEMQFYALKGPDGVTLPIKAHVVTSDNTGIIKGNTEQARVLQTVGVAVGSTAVGTLLGTAFGGLLGAAGNGAVFGVATGGIAGIGYAVLRKGKEVTIPAGARLSIMVDQAVAVN